MEIREVIRRWRKGERARSIAQASGLARNTVDKYLRLAVAAGGTRGGEPPGGSSSRLSGRSAGERVTRLRASRPVALGATVRWVNIGAKPHTVTARDVRSTAA